MLPGIFAMLGPHFNPLAKPTDKMIDTAHAAVWLDGFWAINSRRDFQKAVRAMILAALKAGEIR